MPLGTFQYHQAVSSNCQFLGRDETSSDNGDGLHECVHLQHKVWQCSLLCRMPRSWLIPASLRRATDALHAALKTAVDCFIRRDAHVYDLLTLYRPLAAGTRRLEEAGRQQLNSPDPRGDRGQLVRVGSHGLGASSVGAEHAQTGQPVCAVPRGSAVRRHSSISHTAGNGDHAYTQVRGCAAADSAQATR